jgi:pumilio RNA-binding family
MEGSLAQLDHLVGKHSGDLEATLRKLSSGADNLESVELCSDSAYLEYYDSKVKINPRLPSPRISRESRRLMNRFSKARLWRPVSLDDRSSGRPLTLSTHKEEPEDDMSAELDLSSACDKSTSNIGSHRSELVGLMQVSCPCITVQKKVVHVLQLKKKLSMFYSSKKSCPCITVQKKVVHVLQFKKVVHVLTP